MTKYKRIFALACVVIVLMSCFLIPVNAWDQTVGDVTYSMMSYQYQGIDQGALPYGYYSWAGFLGYYHQNTFNQYYYFELQNTTNGGLSFAPDAGYNVWSLAYSFNQTGFGVGDPVYRFYMPWNNGNGWIFTLMTYQLGNVIFDSSDAAFIQDTSNPSRGYYQFTLDRSILGVSTGWYIHSYYPPVVPPISSNEVSITFNYIDENNVYVGSDSVTYYVTSNVVTVDVPQFPGYINQTAVGNGTYGNGKFSFPSLSVNQIVTVSVWSFDYILSLNDPATLTFRYFYRDSNNNVVFFDETVSMIVPSNTSLSIVIPFPSTLVSPFLGNEEPYTPIYSTSGLSANGRYGYDVLAMTIEQYDNKVVSEYKVSDEYIHDVSSARVEGYDQGYSEGYQNGLSAGGGSGSGSISNPLLFFTEPVVAFLNIEVYPGLPLGVGFLAAMAVCLIVVFLKIFSGG